SRPHQFSPESAGWIFDSRITEQIETMSYLRSSSVSAFLLACWQILLWRHTGEEEIVTECLLDERPFDELHDALGLFARYVPTRGTFGAGLRFDEAVERAMKSLRRAYDSEEFSLRDIFRGKERKPDQAIGFEYEEWPAAEHAGGVTFSYWKQSVCIDR